jgi:AhpD family alkylhydroperoxidase
LNPTAFHQEHHLSTFDHIGLIKDINSNLAPLRKSQPEAMQAFGALAGAAMKDGALSAKHKELIALAIGVTQHCSGCIGFHVKALHKLQCTRAELDEMLSVCVYMGGGPALMYSAEVIKAWDDMAPK